MNKVIRYVKEPWRAVVAFDRHVASIVPDKLFLKCLYRCILGKKLDLKNPQTYNEKLQWIKLYDRDPLYTTMVDKYAAKEYVAKIIGEEHIIPTLGVWDRFDDIDFDSLPDRFVLKCTHSSGDVVICTDKSSFDKGAAKKKLEKCLKTDFYKNAREWPYKNVPRRIIAESFMGKPDEALVDFKFYCLNGKFVTVLACEGRRSERGVRYHFFDKDWNYLPYCPYDDIDFDELKKMKPKKFGEMVDFAEKLSKDLTEVRVDFYEVDGEVYFGELTFFSAGGFDTDITPDADIEIGKKLVLPI